MERLIVFFSGNGNSNNAFPFDPGDTSTAMGQALHANTRNAVWSELPAHQRQEIAAGWAADLWNFGAKTEIEKQGAALYAQRPYPEHGQARYLNKVERWATEYLREKQG